jgi:hypothetical protein
LIVSDGRFNHKTAAEDVHIVGDSDADADESPSISGDRNHVEVEEGNSPESHNQDEEFKVLSPSGSDANSDVLEMILVKDVSADAEVKRQSALFVTVLSESFIQPSLPLCS